MGNEQKELEKTHENHHGVDLSDRQSSAISSKNKLFGAGNSARMVKAPSVGPASEVSTRDTEDARLMKIAEGHQIEEDRADLESRIAAKQWKVSVYYLLTALVTMGIEVLYLYSAFGMEVLVDGENRVNLAGKW